MRMTVTPGPPQEALLLTTQAWKRHSGSAAAVGCSNCDSSLCAPAPLARYLLQRIGDGLDQEERRSSAAERSTATIEPYLVTHPATRGTSTDRRQRPYIISCRKAPLKSTAFSSIISAQYAPSKLICCWTMADIAPSLESLDADITQSHCSPAFFTVVIARERSLISKVISFITCSQNMRRTIP
jgi:hypothetical protein